MKVRNKFYLIPVFVLLLIFFLQSWLATSQQSVTIDEFAHLPAGYLYLTESLFGIYCINPPLIKIWDALPLLFMKINKPEYAEFFSLTFLDLHWPMAYNFMSKNRENFQQIFMAGRTMNILLGLILGFLIFCWSRQLNGFKGGLLSLILFTFCPNMLAHSGLVTVDLGISLTFFATVFTFWWATKSDQKMQESDKRDFHFRSFSISSLFRVCLVGFMLGLAELSKFSANLLYPIILLITIFIYAKYKTNFFKALIQFLLIGVVSLIVINTGYLFQGTFQDQSTLNFISSFMQNVQTSFIAPLLSLFPKAYLTGLDYFQWSSQEGIYPSFLLGEWSNQGWWYFLIICLLLKTPLVTFLILLLAVIKLSSNREFLKKHFLWSLIPILCILLSYSFLSRINIGLRHILPLYPFIFLLAGATLAEHPSGNIILNSENYKHQRNIFAFLKEKKFFWNFAILGLILWFIFSSLSIYPYYLSYFNEIAGGSKNGYKLLSDSNVDWGQDLIHLKKYLDHAGLKDFKMAYFGIVDPEIYGINYDPLLIQSDPGVPVVISASFLMGIEYGIYSTQGCFWISRDFFKYWRDKEPSARIGYSLFIYNLKNTKRGLFKSIK